MATDSGVPPEFFAGWEGEELGIHREPLTPESQARTASTNDGTDAWILALGANSHRLTGSQAESLKGRLTAAGIAYAAFPLTHDYLQRRGEE